ncbi:sugar phosphate isomerase/epimerase family protein [Halocatena halophila]|uniref:sugar phosphate isomerase/epimerase family protein n=1 Tax=Halocatena halophila TaxID=2814576 RepID=UPI002ED2A260
MRFGFSLNAFRQHELADAIDHVASAGYDGVELLLDEPHLVPGQTSQETIDQLRAQLADHNLTISNCNAFMLHAIERSDRGKRVEYARPRESFHHPSFIEPIESDRRARIEHTRRALEMADTLGAPSISIPPGGPLPQAMDRTTAMELFIEGVQAVTPTAERLGIDLLIEPEPNLLIESAEKLLACLDQIDSPAVGCNFDAGHFFVAGGDPTALIGPLAPYTPHYHLEDIPADRTHEHTQLGAGVLDIDGFLSALKERDYDGFVTVELYPYENTAVETATTAQEYLQEHGWM